MEKEIGKLLNKIGSEQVPADVERIAESEFNKFSDKLKEQKIISFKEYFMKTRLIKISVATVIILAVVLGIPFFSTNGPSVSLAGVYEKMQLIDAFMYKMDMVMTGSFQPGMPSGPSNMRGTILISEEYGMRMDTQMDMSVGGQEMIQHQQIYMLPQEKKAYTIIPNIKQYIEMEFTDDLFKRMKKESNDPRDTVKQILKSQYIELGKSTINGIEVEGFETTDPSFTGGMMGDVKVTVWVDSQTWLPVRMEIYIKMNEQVQMEGVMDDFQWGLQVDASEFKPMIPDDYTTPLPGGMKIPSFSEETAIEGLKFLLDNKGEYPEKLDLMTMIKDATDIFGQIEDVNNLSQEAIAQRVVETTLPVQSLVGFYMTLVQDGKEPAYYGDVVSPADVDKVLMRWKTGEDEYRVIYGDLSAETVNGSILAELESQIEQ